METSLTLAPTDLARQTDRIEESPEKEENADDLDTGRRLSTIDK